MVVPMAVWTFVVVSVLGKNCGALGLGGKNVKNEGKKGGVLTKCQKPTRNATQ